MENTKHKQKFRTIILEGLRIAAKKNTELTLGDRKEYVGASDIGQCPRKCYFSKINPTEHTDQEILNFERGHNSEIKFKKALDAVAEKYNFNFLEQPEIVSKNNEWLKAHIDFLVIFEKEEVVIECKDTNHIPEKPYESWILQIQLQMGLLIENGHQVKRGIIVASSSQEIWEYPSIPFDKGVYEYALTRAKNLWRCLQARIEPQAETSALCQFCSVRNSCPNQVSKSNVELSGNIVEMIEEYKKIAEVAKKEKTLKQEIIEELNALGIQSALAGKHNVSLRWQKGREGLDKSKIPLEILQLATTQGNPFPVLKIS